MVVKGTRIITPDARFVYITFNSHAQINIVKKPNKNEVEEHWRSKIPNSYANAKYC